MFDFNGNIIKVPDKLPLLPVKDVVIFPHMIIPLFVGRISSVSAVDDALTKDRLIMLTAQKDQDQDNPLPDGIYKTGTICSILRMHKLSDGRLKILVQGLFRGRIEKYSEYGNVSFVKVKKIQDIEHSYDTLSVEALLRNTRAMLEKVISSGKLMVPDLQILLEEINDPSRAADIIAGNLGLKIDDAQNILEILDPIVRLKDVNKLLTKELEVIDLQSKIKSQARDEISKSQKEYFLKEQMKAIRNELGYSDAKTDEIDELRKKLAESDYPDHVLEEAEKQLRRLETMHGDSSEASIVRTYLDWLIYLPWELSSEDNLDITRAKKILDEDHYDLDKIKERILDYLAVCKLKKSIKGPILCFVGPPGVGKTSLGKSIARAMDRKFMRMSLGGIKDEAEIRGHRRTYVGAMPGRIVQGIKQVNTNNPVFMLDEIDKLGADFKGDPSSALLEVLDPEQNFAFQDNYLGLSFDLSKVLFIGTANHIDTVPPALRDRMEVIYLAGYSEDEKLHIAKQFIIEKQIVENGLKKGSYILSDKILESIIRYYTMEAGLRNLEREISTVFRKIARKVAEGKKVPKNTTLAQIEKYLGVKKYHGESEIKADTVGISTGLAWTRVGGQILYVETSITKGNKGLILTGQLGSVMKESAIAALSYIKANALKFEISPDVFDKIEIHVHVPAGAIPKDGPSAGTTIAASILSAITQRPVRRDFAMTGEITLRGRILPVGGIREKVLAAQRNGIFNIILPMENKKDTTEIPLHIKEKMKFYFIEEVSEVFDLLIVKPRKKKKQANINHVQEARA
ncbi:MAG: endopeptidase La [Pseudomonadota bacterium]